MKWDRYLLCAISLSVFSGFWHGAPPALAPAAVTCNIVTAACTGIGGGTSQFTAATCNGTGNDSPAFASFNTWALGWQGSHSGIIELDAPNGSTCMFMQGGSGTAFSNGLKQFRLVGLGYSGQGDGATFTAQVQLNTSASSAAGTRVVHFSSFAAANIVANEGIVSVNNAAIPAGAAITSVSGTDVTINVDIVSPGIANGDPIRIDGNGWFLAAFKGVIFDNTHNAGIETVAAGASCVNLLTPAQSSLFTVGNYILISGIDMQGFGDPPNPYFYEYPKIASIDAAHKCDGTTAGASVAFTVALANGYKSTWPVFNQGNAGQSYGGGPGTLYALDSGWDTVQQFIGITFDMLDFQSGAQGRDIAFTNVKFTGVNCTFPTQNGSWTVTNSDLTHCNMEVDKINGTVTLDGVTIHQIKFQSASANVFNLKNSTVTSSINGTPKKFVGSNSTIADIAFGAFAYGFTSEVDCTNCVMSAIETTGLGFTDGDQLALAMSGGVIKVPIPVNVTGNANNGSGLVRLTLSCKDAGCITPTAAWTTGRTAVIGGPGGTCPADTIGQFTLTVIDGTHVDLQGSTFSAGSPSAGCTMSYATIYPKGWMVPGATLLWQGRFAYETPAFKVTDVSSDGTNINVQTNLAAGFPPAPQSGGALGFGTHPALKVTCTNCTGGQAALSLSQAPAGAPFGSYFTSTLTAANTSAPAFVFGTISSLAFNVTTPYGGAGTPDVDLNGPFIIGADGFTVSIFSPTVNPKIGGLRTVTSGSVTGAQSGDSLSAPGAIWFVPGQVTAQFGASVGADPVSATVTITTNQNLPYLLKRDLDPASNDNTPMWIDLAA